METKTIMGCLAVFGSAFCFYLATVIIKWSSMTGLKIDASLFTFARFSVGFATVLLVMGIGGYKIKIVKKRLLVGFMGFDNSAFFSNKTMHQFLGTVLFICVFY